MTIIIMAQAVIIMTKTMSSKVTFYHLTVTPLLRGLPKLISKIFESGQRVFILCKDAEQISELDTLLWTFSQKEFIPHDVAGCQNPELQPVLLGTTLSNANKADVAVILNGLPIENQKDFSKCVYVFYGNKDDLEVRTLCKMYEDYKRKAINPIFWQQSDDGKWEQVKAVTCLDLCSD